MITFHSSTKKINTLKIHNYLIQIMEDAETAKRDHQRNKSEIVKLVKEMFSQGKWGDGEYKGKLQELVTKDEELVQEVIRKIKIEKGIE
jgi:hypothetical protein